MGEKAFDGPIAGGDLWSMGFDVDLNLDSRKHGFNNTGPNPNDTMNYGDMLLHRFDGLNDGDITDLTNSLPKGDTETTAQSLIACHELKAELANQATQNKCIETCLFSQQNPVSNEKLPVQPFDVYGRVSLYDGKLVLQLRHFNVNTNYPLGVEECWLCREKLCNGSPIHSHKHVLQGLFQINNEFIQMDIDHYIIPDQALDPEPVNVKEIGLMNSHAISLNDHTSSTLGLMQSIKSPNIDNVNCLQSSLSSHKDDSITRFPYSDLQVNVNPAISLTSVLRTSNSYNEINQTKGSDIGHSNSSAIIDLQNTVSQENTNENFFNPINRSVVTRSTDNRRFTGTSPESSLYNNHLRTDNFDRHTTYEPNISQKGNNFFDHYYHTYPSYDQNFTSSQPSEKIQSTSTLPTVNETEPVYQILSTIKKTSSSSLGRTNEIGARRRKSRTQRNISSIKMSDETNADYLPKSSGISLSVTDLKKQNLNLKLQVTPVTKAITATVAKTLLPNATSSTATVTTSYIGTEIKTTVSETQKVKVPVVNTATKPNIKAAASSKITSKTTKPRTTKKSLRKSIARIEKLRKIVCRDLIVSCQICRLEFKNNSSFKDHLLEHKLSPSFVFLCSCCSKSVSNIDKFLLHLKTHSSNRISCKLCGTSFSKIDKLERHFDNIHRKYSPYKCDICKKCFFRSDTLKKHRHVHFDNQYPCDICHKLYSSSYNLEIHKLGHLSIQPFACNLCNKSFPRIQNLESHKSSVHNTGNKKFKCDICSKFFSRIDVLNRHTKNIHEEATEFFTCESCNKKFRRKDQLMRHMREHNGPKLFKCNMCPSAFGRKQVLQKHLKIHNEKEQCNICLKFVLSSNQLKKHLRWHEAQIKVRFEREYLASHKCDLCPKSFKSKEVLQSHVLRIHYRKKDNSKTIPAKTVDKKFICELCSKGFTRSCNLKSHMKTHAESNSKSSEDEAMLDNLPTVLKRKKNSSFILDSVKSNSISNDYANQSSVSKEQVSSTSNFLLPLEENFIPTAHVSNYNPHAEISCTSPNSPINLSTEALTAAAYLLAHPFYEGSYP